MKPHPRIRKTIKWTGAAVSVLLMVAWIGSGWIAASLKHTFTVSIAAGVLTVYPYGVEFSHGDNREGFQWAFDRQPNFIWSLCRGDRYCWMISLWIPSSCALLVTLTAWRLDTLARRRARLNLCPKCNYDRTGLAAGAVCPECGSGGTSA
jgi:hypothetical protein